jgi:segregation and condensation protein B
MAAVEPVEPQMLAQLVEIPVAEVEALCVELAEEYERQGRGFALVRVAGGYRYQTQADLAPYVERFVLEGQTARLSPAALETLAIVAYKQPVSRAQLSAIRGVNVDSTLTTLEQRGYVEEVGNDPGPGQAILYGTTKRFLEQMGLDSLAELPPLADFVPEAEVVEALERGLHLRAEEQLAAEQRAEDEERPPAGPGSEPPGE